MSWLVGEPQRLESTFTPDAADSPPTTPVVVRIRKPDGTKEDEQQATKESDTEFYYDYTPSMAGTHVVVFESNDGAKDDYKFKVEGDQTE